MTTTRTRAGATALAALALAGATALAAPALADSTAPASTEDGTGTLSLEIVLPESAPAGLTPEDFTVTATGPETITGASGSPEVTEATVPAGTYALSVDPTSGELDGVRWRWISTQCWVDGVELPGTAPTVDVGEGQSVSCFFLFEAGWGGAGGTKGCLPPPIELRITKLTPDGERLSGATFSTSNPPLEEWLIDESGAVAYDGTLYDPAAMREVMASHMDGWHDLAPLQATPLTDSDGQATAALDVARQNPTPCKVLEALSSTPRALTVLTETTVPADYEPAGPLTLWATGSASIVEGENSDHLDVQALDLSVTGGTAEITSQGWDNDGAYVVDLEVVDEPVPVTPTPTPTPTPIPTPTPTPAPEKPAPPRVSE